MIKSLSIVTVWTTDQERDKKFFVETLGFTERMDLHMGDMRWITVSPPGQPEVQLTLMRPDGPGLDPESQKAVETLVHKGALGAGVFATDDCRATYAELKAKGVEFVQEPQERPYGIEALFRDPSGNWYSLTQQWQQEGLDMSKPWSGCVEEGEDGAAG
ncbi:catechol 2,3-dioxygenase-like lactoylglutathione lyase family enzyme [Streptomyces sp. Amel2xB2]|uniref:VOC family protein n=1 Tax=Streptomyces sp. Amel2xB2 TaxID=1305829 RepID=UPI000DB942C3|nr:VOC family protein [Streptomyces sp. Amel2xB2]RAJ55415.1 catechol 2,3-dioxygenase-like lactoylglutathione lyase family enzyme [Streptomyces sp. Amel2xB2]